MSLENYGRYQLVKKLAMGGMAQIYLARRKGPEASDTLVVVKRILPHLAENLEFVRMFLDEARIAARLAHPNIVQIHDLGAQDDSFFLAMEYIHGEDVRRMCKRAEAQGRPLPVPLACRIVIDACAGLDYAHKKTDATTGKPLGIVHRDVSPQNILVSFDGTVKVVDFGIAKAADQATVTRSGVLKGKYSYMSPEQAAGKRVDCRSDVFALGVVLYELLTGTRLFKRASDMQTLSAVAECQVTPPSQVSPRVPEDLDAIVMRALAKDPDTRFAEALQLQVALEEWLSAHQLPSTTADLAAFMSEVYAERLAREKRAGQVMVDEDPPATGQRTAVEGHRRSGGNPSVSSKEVTRADRGEPVAAADVELTGRTRPLRPSRSIDLRREPEGERLRSERRTVTPRQTDARRPEPEPPARMDPDFDAPSETRRDFGPLTVSRVEPEALSVSVTDTTRIPSRAQQAMGRRWWLPGVIVFLSAAVVAAALWVVLAPAAVSAPGPNPTMPPGTQAEGDFKAGAAPAPEPPPAPVVVSPAATPSPTEAPPVPKVEEPPPAVEVQLTLETEPAQATLFVDGKERGAGPLVIPAKADQEFEVRVEAAQHRALTRRVKVKAGPPQLERLVLEPLPKPSPPQAPIKSSRADPPKPAPAPEPAKALVRFAVTPWAQVSCGGRNLGSTPFGDVELPVGVYQCRFHNPESGRTITQRVEVKATGLNKVIVKF